MRLHARHMPLITAEATISTAVNAAVEDHYLTYAELVSILSSILASWTKWELRSEREEKP